MGQRVIPCAITAEYVAGDGVTLGAAGSHSNVVIEFDFRAAGPMWEGTTKYVLWTNPQGNSTNRVDLGVDKLVDGYENVYHASPTADAMCVAGWAEMVVVGVTVETTTDEDSGETTSKETLKVKTEPSRFRVLPGSSRSSDNEGVAATVADQLQTEIEAIDKRKVNKPVTPYDPNGEEGHVLVSLGGGRTKWATPEVADFETVEDVLEHHMDWVTTVQEGAITGRHIAEKTKVWRNVADFVPAGEELTSDTIADAFAAALADGDHLYIPAGEYVCHLYVNRDCTILLDRDTVLETDSKIPAVLCEDCSVKIYGGAVLAGTDYTTREYIYPFERFETSVEGIIQLNRCHDSRISGVRCENSNFASVICMYDCLRTEVTQCDFRNAINTFIYIGSSSIVEGEPVRQSGQIRVAGCRFENVVHKTGASWCYAVYTGGNMSTFFFPPDGLVYENNYVRNTEDCALDTHGASNVIIRNNIVLDTVNAITAYNDNNRVTRPEGWNMHNILIENNFCETTKVPERNAAYQTEDYTFLPHAFVFLGSGDSPQAQQFKGSTFYDYSNLVVRNNFLRTPNTYLAVIYLGLCSSNVTIEGNTVDLRGTDGQGILMLSCMGFAVRNNIIKNTTNGVYFRHSWGEMSGNVIHNISLASTAYSYIKGLTHGIYGEPNPLCVACGDRLWHDNAPKKCQSFNLRAVDGAASADISSQSGTLEDKVVTVDDNYYVPLLSIEMTGGGNTYNTFIDEMLDFNRFRIRDSAGSIPDGTYTITARKAVIKPDTALEMMSIVNGAIDAKAEPQWGSATVKNLAQGTSVLVDLASLAGESYYAAYFVDNGNLVQGYILSTHLNIQG